MLYRKTTSLEFQQQKKARQSLGKTSLPIRSGFHFFSYLSAFLPLPWGHKKASWRSRIFFRCRNWRGPCWVRETPCPSPGSTQYTLYPRNHKWEDLLLPQCRRPREPTTVCRKSSSRELGGESKSLAEKLFVRSWGQPTALNSVCGHWRPEFHFEQGKTHINYSN